MADQTLEQLAAEIVRCHRIIEDLTNTNTRLSADVARLGAALDAILDGARDPISVAQAARTAR